MFTILDLGYLIFLSVVWPVLLFRRLVRGKYRTGWREKFWGLVPIRTGDRPSVWLHAVSVGEVQLIGSLVAHLRRERPDVEIVISATTATGYELACRRFREHRVCYAPLDFSWAVRRAVARLRPDLLIFVELELWPQWIRAAQEAGARVAIVNGRLSPRSFSGYRRILPFIRPVVRSLELIACQNETIADRFRQLGGQPAAVTVTGSLKFDRAMSDRHNPATLALRRLAHIEEDDLVFIAGSTQEPEEEMALQTYQSLCPRFPHLRLIVVPRHAERFDAVDQLLQRSGLPFARRSQIEEGNAVPRILLVDTIGELSAWWGTAHIAFVGGSMGTRGGQNMIEPSAFGAAVCFGPKTKNFEEIVRLLLENRAAHVVHSQADMIAFVRRCLEDIDYRTELGRRAQIVVERHGGATEKTWHRLAPLIRATRRAEAA